MAAADSRSCVLLADIWQVPFPLVYLRDRPRCQVPPNKDMPFPTRPPIRPHPGVVLLAQHIPIKRQARGLELFLSYWRT
jgi:hypothetical protein